MAISHLRYNDLREEVMDICYKKKYKEKENENSRNLKKFQLLNQWMKLKIRGIQLKEFLEDREIRSIAIYGMGELGWLFYDELKFCGVGQLVTYGIDQNGNQGGKEISIYSLCSTLEKTDAIIITPVLITDLIEDAIYKELGEQVTFTLEEVLYELSRKHRIPSELWKI